jgi:hypothetical protein
MRVLFFSFFILFANSFAMAQSTTNESDTEVVAPVDVVPVANLQKTGDVGVGVVLGTPTGFNMKLWTAETTAFNMSLAFASGDVALIGDHLWHFRRAFSTDPAVDTPSVLVPYIGIGLMAIFDTTARNENRDDRPLYRRTANDEGPGLGARIPIGLEFLPQDQRFGFYGELAPGSIVSPTSFSFVQAGVGGRYYF